jgi:6-phosphogluconolactonase
MPRPVYGLGIPWWIFVGTGDRGIQLLLMKTSEDPNIPEFVTVTVKGLVAEAVNPTFLLLDPRRRVLFCVSEVDAGTVRAFAIAAGSGKLTSIDQRPSGGARPCHLALTRDGKQLLVANAGGSVAVLPVGPEGRLAEATDVRRQGKQPQGVTISPDGRLVLVCDRGLDRVMVYRLEDGKLAPHERPFVALKAGAGPRRLAFRPDGKFAYVINELTSTVTTLAYDVGAGALEERQTLSTVPGYYDGPNRPSEIVVHPGGKYLYVSNCGHHSVVLFAIDPAGTLTYVEDQSTYGTMPVHFGMDTPGQHFAVANRESGSILILRAPENGRVKPGGDVVKMPAPTCAVFLSPF